MDPIFLTPETTFEVSIKPVYSKSGMVQFLIEDGGPYKIRSATGREYGRLQFVMRKEDIDAAYKILPTFLVEGVPGNRYDDLHPDIVWSILLEVAKRSQVSEEAQGK